MTHANAYLSPRGRLALAQLVVDEHWPLRRAAERFQCSPATAKKWADRYRDGGKEAMRDRSSRPHHCPHRTAPRREPNGGSSGCGSPAAGGHTASATTCTWPDPPSKRFCAAIGCRG